MASTNKTEILGLSQWVASDAAEREDFNTDNRLIEEAFGKRLEWELITSVDREPMSSSRFTVGLGGAKMADYMVIIVATPSITNCSMYLNDATTGPAPVYSGAILVGFPMRNPDQSAFFVNVENMKTGCNGMFKALSYLTFKEEYGGPFERASKIRVWGIK